ncbi:ricin-type beta-trefoil lectin domain protein [Streptomyces sp. NPDC001678]|uniref:RICIN domain-containing protein n=1 Tax=Streptomyces sp. NPDC001678 TaxID=3364599 RepID=UPI0036AF6467
MKKRGALRFIVAVVAASAIGITTASPASANGWIQWKNKKTGLCLGANGPNSYAVMKDCGEVGGWYEENIDGTWRFKSTGAREGGQCLDSSTRGSVYWGACEGYGNMYQRWQELSYGPGWVLKNAQTKLCLMSDPSNRIYTGNCDGDNEYQYWA